VLQAFLAVEVKVEPQSETAVRVEVLAGAKREA
jgi:hypothetical protein